MKNNYFTYLETCPKGHEKTYQKFLNLAKKLKSTVEIYQVAAGFTVKKAPEMGYCYEDFKYLQSWNFEDEPTKDCVVFWIPKIQGLDKPFSGQEKILSEYDCKFESASLQIGLLLAHFQRTNERLPENYNYVRTSTFHVDGRRLLAGSFNESGLYCHCWDEGAGGYVGFFLLGVESLETGLLGTSSVGHLETRVSELESKFDRLIDALIKR